MTDKQENESSLDAGIRQYNEEKPEGDIDLVAEVRNILMSNGLGQRLPTCYDNNVFIVEAVGKSSNVQRFLINRYWNQQLMLSNKPATEERYCLIPNGRVEDWISLFKDKIMPFILENDLPVTVI